MSGQDLMDELSGKIALLDKALGEFGRRGRAYAQAEHDYRTALSSEIAKERADGTPVSIINDLCRGKPHIAKQRLERDISEVVYKAAGEAINSYKLQIRVLEGQIDREWRG